MRNSEAAERRQVDETDPEHRHHTAQKPADRDQPGEITADLLYPASRRDRSGGAEAGAAARR
jgi:hypothetical protein